MEDRTKMKPTEEQHTQSQEEFDKMYMGDLYEEKALITEMGLQQHPFGGGVLGTKIRCPSCGNVQYTDDISFDGTSLDEMKIGNLTTPCIKCEKPIKYRMVPQFSIQVR